ncbi:hypothetical protein AAG906_029092 [Vitis piasezkii]
MSVDGGIFFSEIFPATKQSINRKCYSMIFSIADKTELNMDIARHQARINQLVREMLVEASDSMSFFHPSWKFWFIFIRFGFELCFLDVGLLNGQFQLVQTIRAAGDCQLVAKMILVYCTLIGKNIRAIANYLTKPNVNYAGAAVHAGHLGIRSCSIGAQSILHACCLFVQACAYGSKERLIPIGKDVLKWRC